MVSKPKDQPAAEVKTSRDEPKHRHERNSASLFCGGTDLRERHEQQGVQWSVSQCRFELLTAREETMACCGYYCEKLQNVGRAAVLAQKRRITISITAPEAATDQDLLSLEIPTGMTVADFKALIQSETTFPSTSQHLYHNGLLLTDELKTLEELSIGDGEMLAMHVRETVGETGVPPAGGRGLGQASSSTSRAPPSGGNELRGRRKAQPDAEMTRLQILGDPRGREKVQRSNPELAAAVEDPERFRQLFEELLRQQDQAELERQREIARLNDDPFNPEAQAKIAELIRLERVTENLQNALEHNPEAFGKVVMLYIDVQVNGHKVKAFVDSGAQVTVMSPACAEACGIMRLVDRQFSGVAVGVGTANIIGRVHMAPIKIGDVFLGCSFTVMEGKDVDLLLGLDMLKRHQAIIDLTRGVLRLQGTEVSFLGEADIPKREGAEGGLDEPTVEGPGGTKLGTKSGAVYPADESDSAANPGASASTAAESGLRSGNFQGDGQSLSSASQSQSAGSSAQPRQALLTPQGPPQQEQQSGQSQPQYPPQAVEQLQQLGFSREEAIAALNVTGGNVDYAAGLLFQER
ncbi:MAG: DNA damage-inducible protein 1 [Sclerophora amabilis]|nr:MAG: DNA damage-inducible protein 1 [Sclerophora amabilis]